MMAMAVASELGLTGIRELSARMTIPELIEYLGFRKLRQDAADEGRLRAKADEGLRQAKARPRR